MEAHHLTMELGVVGKPNVGKSTFFVASTLAPAEIANYPFTTVKPNRGVAHVRVKCPCGEFNTHCDPRSGRCVDGVRFVAVEVIDVAGLVPGAHKGRGLGNQFLDDLRQAGALVHVVDATGETDSEGVATSGHDPLEDVKFLEDEIVFWIKDIMVKQWEKKVKTAEVTGRKMETFIAERLAGLGVKEKHVMAAIREADVGEKPSRWTEEEQMLVARALRKIMKPMIIAANKADKAPPENIERLRKGAEELGYKVVPTSSDFELGLRRAAKAGLIDYRPGATSFKIVDETKVSEAQRKALKVFEDYLAAHQDVGTGVQACIEHVIFKLLDLIVVYPVEDEGKLTDKDGRVLPDAYLVRRDGTTAKEVAFMVHTDLGNGFIRAINVRNRRVVGADHIVQDGDIIKIVSSK